MLVDANLLLYAVDRQSPFHGKAREWLEEQLTGSRRVGLAWQSLGSFLRIATHPRIFERPLGPEEAWERVSEWLHVGVTWIPDRGQRHASILGDLIVRYRVTGALVPDAQLAALALEHGLTIYSADSDFARFPEVEWRNPVAPA
jgi:toxin-antitoxin system PIN domain toxin